MRNANRNFVDMRPLLRRRVSLFAIASAMLMLTGAQALAQQPTARRLSLEEAVRAASTASEDVAIARAGITRASGEQMRARSQYLPQLYGSASYTRALKSEFEGLSLGADTTQAPSADCGPFDPQPAHPIGDRVSALEGAVECITRADPFALFRNLPFGQENTFSLGLSVSQNVFAGGRVVAMNRASAAGRRSADLGLAAAEAQLVLDVAQAYFDAVLSDRLVTIAEATLDQTETTFRQTQLAVQVGAQPEFDLLRAQVARDNQRPAVIQRRADRDLAYLRLKQLADVPLDVPVVLTTELGDDVPAIPGRLAVLQRGGAPDTVVDERAPVRQAEEFVSAQEALLDASRAQRLPAITLSSQYGRVAYPRGGIPGWSEFRSNWTVTLGLQVPLFTGGRLQGERLVAQANLLEARARLQQSRELAELDTRNALARLEAAEALWAASAGTEQQAVRAYSIAELRYREGLSTQVELTDSQILLQQAQANRAVAARDLQIARLRVALLRDLPLAGAPALQQQIQVPLPQQQAPQQLRPGLPATAGAQAIQTGAP